MNALKLLLLLLAVLVLGQTTQWPVADQAALALGGLIVFAWLWSRLSLRGLTLERTLTADRAQVGGVVREQIVLRNTGRLGKLWLEAADRSTLPGHAAGRALHVRGRSSAAWEVVTPCVRRGRYRLGPMMLRGGDPLGIFPARLTAPDAHDVVVYPAMVPLPDAPAPVAALDGGVTQDRRTQNVTPSIAGVRDYTPGDAYNRISWSQTARRGRLMVKEFDRDQTADVWLVLDLDRAVHLPADRRPRLEPDAAGVWPIEAWLDSTEEYAVAIAASLAHHFLSEGRNVGLIATGAHLEIQTLDRGDRQLVKMLESLAVVTADGHSPLAEMLLAEGRRFTRQAGLVAITPSTDDRWVGALSELAARGVRTSAVVVEPSTFGDAPPSLLAVSALLAAAIPTQLVKYGDRLAATLSAAASSNPVGQMRRR
ncbi:MAG: DUF58 domain-containing protein [Thermomicrobiales bacterium]|nr:DUF58 domain-containing protein [Thermomicrobiales bacterium]